MSSWFSASRCSVVCWASRQGAPENPTLRTVRSRSVRAGRRRGKAAGRFANGAVGEVAAAPRLQDAALLTGGDVGGALEHGHGVRARVEAGSLGQHLRQPPQVLTLLGADPGRVEVGRGPF